MNYGHFWNLVRFGYCCFARRKNERFLYSTMAESQTEAEEGDCQVIVNYKVCTALRMVRNPVRIVVHLLRIIL